MSRTTARITQTLPRRPEPRGLSRIDAAAYFGIGTTLFDQLVESGKIPRPFRLEGRVIWDRYRLDAAIDELQDAESGGPSGNVWDDVG
jgi:hypothetical protein